MPQAHTWQRAAALAPQVAHWHHRWLAAKGAKLEACWLLSQLLAGRKEREEEEEEAAASKGISEQLGGCEAGAARVALGKLWCSWWPPTAPLPVSHQSRSPRLAAQPGFRAPAASAAPQGTDFFSGNEEGLGSLLGYGAVSGVNPQCGRKQFIS